MQRALCDEDLGLWPQGPHESCAEEQRHAIPRTCFRILTLNIPQQLARKRCGAIFPTVFPTSGHFQPPQKSLTLQASNGCRRNTLILLDCDHFAWRMPRSADSSSEGIGAEASYLATTSEREQRRVETPLSEKVNESK